MPDQKTNWTIDDLLPNATNSRGDRLYIGMSGALAKITGEALCDVLSKAAAQDPPPDLEHPKVKAAAEGVQRMLDHESSIQIIDEVRDSISDCAEAFGVPSPFAR